jgi:hypothetical protein
VVGSLRLTLSIMLWATMLVFLVFFALRFPHPSEWDTWRGVVVLRNWGNLVVSQIDSWLEWPSAAPYYPLVLAILCLLTQILLDAFLRRLYRPYESTVEAELEAGPS